MERQRSIDDLQSTLATEEPLVSIIVITYNSAKYVLDTLESIKAQTYKNIEIIVSDDCSSDDTIEICTKWLNINKYRFVNTHLVRSEFNSGISANCNRGIKSASGSWVKLIAGDDILDNNSTLENLRLFADNDVHLICSTIYKVNNDDFESLKLWPLFIFPRYLHEQLRLQLIGGFIKSCGVFIRARLFEELGNFDERYPYIEDDPFWIKALNNGYKFHYNSRSKVFYRITQDSVTQPEDGRLFKLKFFQSFYCFKKEVVLPMLKREYMYKWYTLNLIEVEAMKRLMFLEKPPKVNSKNKLSFLIIRIISSLRKREYLKA